MYALNLKTAVAACQGALPHLLQSGGGMRAARIVNVGAMGAAKAAAGMGAYAASKAGVAKLTEALADELKGRGITVNAILPSTLDTPRNRLDMPKADFSRWVTLTEAAEVIAFLVSDEASAVTGALIPVVGRV
jgi:NAD(P)-dependent dehydrogenase (short-subunit alcohol dehydrogenase family)